MGVRNQFLATAVLCTVTIGVGLTSTWPSSIIILFSSENTTLSRPMTGPEISLFGSLSSIGSMLVTPFFGYLIDAIGRKYLTMFIILMQVVTWIIRMITKNVEMILFSCVIDGIGGCGLFIVGVYISEISQESIRGALTSTTIVTCSLGMLISFWIGGTLDYYVVIYICFTIAAVGTVLIWFLNDSPTYLMKKGLQEEAKKSIAFYRNWNVDTKEVLLELDTIRKALKTDVDETQSPGSTIKQKFIAKWQFIRNSKSSQRAFGLCLALALMTVFHGLTVVQTYAVPLFEKAAPNLSSTMCAVIMAAVSGLAAIVSGYLTDVAGRKTLLIYASLVEGASCLALSTQLQMSWGPDWLVPVFIYLYCAAYSFGAGTVLFVLLAELFLPEIKGIANALIVEMFFLANFTVLYIFNPLVYLIGIESVFYIFAVVCFLTTVFAVFLLPETKGLPVGAIQMQFYDKNNKKG